jgi:leucyl-tRNA synthetase
METGGLIVRAAWPKADPKYLVEDEIELPVQVNGKLRATAKAPKNSSQADLERIARAAVTSHLEGKQVVKVVVVAKAPLVNFVVR